MKHSISKQAKKTYVKPEITSCTVEQDTFAASTNKVSNFSNWFSACGGGFYAYFC
jgi:hypothetical protein